MAEISIFSIINLEKINCFARNNHRREVKKDLVHQLKNLEASLSQIDSSKKGIDELLTYSVSLERSKEDPNMEENITDILHKCTTFIDKYNKIIGNKDSWTSETVITGNQQPSSTKEPADHLVAMIARLKKLELSMPRELNKIKWKRKLAKWSRDIANHVKLAEDVHGELEREYITMKENEDANAENIVKEHLLHLSNQMKIVEEMNMKILSKGYNLPKQSRKWLEAATDLTNEVYGALKEQQNTKSYSRINKEPKLMCEKIYDCMKNRPFEDTINQPIAFMASIHRIEDGTTSESTLKQTAKKETISSKMILISCGRVGDGSLFLFNFISLDLEKNCRKKVPSPYYGGAQVPNYPSKDEKKFKSEIIEVDDDAQEHRQNTRHEESDPNDEFSFSGEGGLSTEKTPPELGPSIPISITGEISAEVSSSSSSQEISILNSDFTLDPNREKQSSTYSLPEHLMSPTGTLKADKIASSGEGGLQTEKNPPKLGLIIPISITGEMSEYMNLRVEFPTTSNSQETSNLSSVFGLDPNKDKYSVSELELEKQRSTSSLPEHLIVMSTTGTPKAEEWRGAVVVNLIEKNIISLVDEPHCPNLGLLFLQRNKRLTRISPHFFNQMPALRFLDFSETRIGKLPSSLFKLTNLELLMLRSCVCLESLPGDVKNLTKMKWLDLSGTDLYDVPQELGKVEGLRLLHLQLYHPDYKSGYAGLPDNLMTPDTINTMQALESLSIVVHPEDQRWKNIVADIIMHIGKLKMLSYLHFYFPTVEGLQNFTENSPSWENQRLRRFNFIVGDDVKRIISRVPSEVESKYKQYEKCLRFVNGNEVGEVMKTTLKLASAFYLDHHIEAKSLSDFGISNCKELKFCVVRECPKLEFFMTRDEESSETAFPNLEYLGLHYLWKLEKIWKDPVPSGSFKSLTYLMVANCHKLEYIASHSILKCLSRLMTFKIEDCESLMYIVEDNEMVNYDDKDGALLPQLTELELRHLPKLEALGSGILIPPKNINAKYCPKLKLNAIPQNMDS